MSEPYYHHLRAGFLPLACVVASALVLALPAPAGGKTTAAGLGLAVGFGYGFWLWRRVRRRVDPRNAVILYATDTLTYPLLFVAAMVSFVPGSAFRLARLLSARPEALAYGLAVALAAWPGNQLALFLGVRAWEKRHGPLKVKQYHARAATGEEGMLRKRGVVVAACDPTGTVKVEGEMWRATSITGEAIDIGRTVVVHDIEGLMLLVEAIAEPTPDRGGSHGTIDIRKEAS